MSSHTCGRWYLPIFLISYGLLTLTYNVFYDSIEVLVILIYTMTCGVAVVICWVRGLEVFFEPLPKCSWGSSNIFIITFQPFTFKPTFHPILFSDVIFVLVVIRNRLDTVFILNMFNAHTGYLHLKMVVWRCSCCRHYWLQHTALTAWLSVLTTLYFAEIVWCLSHCRCWSLWIGFLYTVVARVPWGCGVTGVSRKGMEPSAPVSSTVNLNAMMNCCVLKELILVCWFYYHKVFHRLGGGWCAEDFNSKFYMKKLATMELIDDPMATPLWLLIVSALEQK